MTGKPSQWDQKYLLPQGWTIVTIFQETKKKNKLQLMKSEDKLFVAIIGLIWSDYVILYDVCLKMPFVLNCSWINVKKKNKLYVFLNLILKEPVPEVTCLFVWRGCSSMCTATHSCMCFQCLRAVLDSLSALYECNIVTGGKWNSPIPILFPLTRMPNIPSNWSLTALVSL